MLKSLSIILLFFILFGNSTTVFASSKSDDPDAVYKVRDVFDELRGQKTKIEMDIVTLKKQLEEIKRNIEKLNEFKDNDIKKTVGQINSMLIDVSKKEIDISENLKKLNEYHLVIVDILQFLYEKISQL